jgi:hypothetical protein
MRTVMTLAFGVFLVACYIRPPGLYVALPAAPRVHVEAAVAPVVVAPVADGLYCYDYNYSGQSTGRKCFGTREAYCASECAEANPLAQQACSREC